MAVFYYRPAQNVSHGKTEDCMRVAMISCGGMGLRGHLPACQDEGVEVVAAPTRRQSGWPCSATRLV
jgi:hypothetical protein